MTTLSNYLRQAGVSEDAAEAAQAFNDLADHFQPIPSFRVLAWMGEGGRLAKLKGFVAATADSADPQTIGLRSAIETVLLAVANPSTEIDMTPGSPHRFLLAVIVSVGALSQADADALVWRGWVDGFTPATAESVTTARAANVAADAAAAARAEYEAARNAWGVQVYAAGDAELARRLAAGEPMPTLAELVEFVQGTLA